MTNPIDPKSVWTVFAWMISIIAGALGATMVIVGMIEEVPSIVRWTLQRTTKWRRRS
jgi:hypothetical protein